MTKNGKKLVSNGLNLLIYPSTLVGASRIGKVGESLQSSGLFSETQIVGIHNHGLKHTEHIANNVRIIRIKGTSLKGNVGRVLKILFWQPRVFFTYRKLNISSVAAHNVWVLPLAYKISKKTSSVLVYNAHELETETGAIKGFKQLFAKYIENKYIKHVDIISVVNESIADWYNKTYIGIPRPIPITNSPVDGGEPVDIRKLIGIPDTVMLYIHTGHLVHGRNIPLIVDSFTSRPNKHVVFLGDGPLRSIIETAASSSSNIHWIPPVHPNSVVSYCRKADVGLCLIGHISLSDKLSTPNKLMEALGAGIPSLTSDLLEAKRLLGANSDFWVLESTDEESLSLKFGNALDRISKQHVLNFQRDWNGIPTWQEQISPLIEEYQSYLVPKTTNSV